MVTNNKLDRNIRGMLDLIQANGGTVRIKHVKAPSVANAHAEGITQHYIFGLYFDQLDTMTPIVSSASWIPRSEEFQIKPQFFNQRALAQGGIDERTTRGLSCWARYAAGFTVVEITVGEDKFYGRAICSLQDRWNSNIGTVKALSMAFDDALVSGHDLGTAWAQYLGRRSAARAEKLLSLAQHLQEVAA
jgi:hypothetical protein